MPTNTITITASGVARLIPAIPKINPNATTNKITKAGGI